MSEAQRNEYPVDRLVKLRLRHYGNTRYKHDLFKPICDVPFRNKPKGGLWTSPVDSEYGWKDWSEDNQYGDLSIHFDLAFEGTVLEIDSVEDMNELPWIEQEFMHFVSFEPLVFMGYDAIHLTNKGQCDTRLTYPKSLYGWDCETVLVMNADAILAT
jgi:hypothetical protein